MNLALTWRLLKGGGRRGMLGTWLTLGAVAVSTALLLFAIAANFAFQARADRGAWRNPVPASSGAVAVEKSRYDFVRDQVITVVDLAALGEKAPAPPPGLPRFPRPGEAWLSPALAELARELPADQLAARYPRQAGVLGDEALVYPGELVAVVGHAPDAPELQAPPGDAVVGRTPVKVADLEGQASNDADTYGALAVIASVLMVVPLLVFGGAAARLTVARRDQRLAALRLVGATPGQVVLMTVAEAMIVALAGALAGTVAYILAAPLLAGIEMQGGPWFTSDVFPHPLVMLAVLVGVPLVVGLSAVAGLRRVVVSPLGVAKRETPPGMRFVRVLALLAVLVAYPVLTRGENAGVAIIAAVLALAFLCVNLVGPWVVGLIGRITARLARGPVRLLAGRRLVDDPRSAWRTVSGVALTGFVAGFVGLLSPAAFDQGPAGPPELRVVAPAGQVEQMAGQARERLREAGVTATVEPDKSVVVAALGSSADVATVDRARTALAGMAPGHTPTTQDDDTRFSDQLFADIRVGTVVVLAVSFLVAVASSGITAMSSVLDRRQTYGLLRLAGTPLSVLDKARRAETLIPLTVMGGGAILVGVFCALPFISVGMSSAGAITLGVCIVAGFAGVIGAGALSRPLLKAVTADPAPRPD
ncbi:FtsX-like permease family protein [Nonomuraea terrae]|uniref:FtsX-like permease family protein n=1 Tax=Nonomuraea terrae TaxID=2530383 RepID=UPI0037A9FDF1